MRQVRLRPESDPHWIRNLVTEARFSRNSVTGSRYSIACGRIWSGAGASDQIWRGTNGCFRISSYAVVRFAALDLAMVRKPDSPVGRIQVWSIRGTAPNLSLYSSSPRRKS